MKRLLIFSHEPELGDWYPCLELSPELRPLAHISMVTGRETAATPDDLLRAGAALLAEIDQLVQENAADPTIANDLAVFAMRHSMAA